MGAAKVHFKDRYGAICGAYGSQIYVPHMMWSNDTQKIICLKCIKKLIEMGHGLQRFSELVRDAIK